MKSDLDNLMKSQELEAILITGPGLHNPPMVYMTGGAFLTYADLIKTTGKSPVLFYRSMERDEAARTGLQMRNIDDYHLDELLKRFDGDLLATTVERYRLMFGEMGISHGKIGVYGQIDAGQALALFTALQSAIPNLEFLGQFPDAVLVSAMQTKDQEEIERIRKMGQITVEVVGKTADFLSSHRAVNETLVKLDGNPLTIGDVKRYIDLWLVERGAENPEGTIFAIGRDAGVPHSTGINTNPLLLGQTIVFDIFPRLAESGYYHDFTRTWCLGFATDEVYTVYEDVYSVFTQIKKELHLGASCRDMQALACDLFEARDHPTQRSDPNTTNGFVHSLGHGLGLHIHEQPFFRLTSPEDLQLEAGNVFTVEPGLYYPERGLGIRLEDTVWARQDGVFETLADFPYDLVLPIKK